MADPKVVYHEVVVARARAPWSGKWWFMAECSCEWLDCAYKENVQAQNKRILEHIGQNGSVEYA